MLEEQAPDLPVFVEGNFVNYILYLVAKQFFPNIILFCLILVFWDIAT